MDDTKYAKVGSSPLARGTLHSQRARGRSYRFIPAGAGNTKPTQCQHTQHTVHPRWRGEHEYGHAASATEGGSSPLARGTPLSLRRRTLDVRFIPAGAGNTRAATRAPRAAPVHPRWRGEHVPASSASTTKRGSSPLARGTLRSCSPCSTYRRFIPAGAGNTAAVAPSERRRAVHPRWRGEHGEPELVEADDLGSSPLARGTRFLSGQPFATARFIPAGAGNTLGLSPSRHPGTVHPRWRGEHGIEAVSQDRDGGSSPLARGTRIHNLHSDYRDRFIPAGAGNTISLRHGLPPWSVHPRWRGEHSSSSCRLYCSAGSSPLARGTHLAALTRIPQARFIPAGAGNTSTRPSAWRTASVHPRWRGEHRDQVAQVLPSGGSSPLARGTRLGRCRRRWAGRFIPAGAGNTRRWNGPA